MSTPTARDNVKPPAVSRRFTSFAAQKTLTVVDGTNGSPTGVTWRPCQVIIEADAGEVFSYIDDAGVAVPMVFKATGTYGPFRMSPITIETGTTVDAVTVFWSGSVE
jgi:hypothetical protein